MYRYSLLTLYAVGMVFVAVRWSRNVSYSSMLAVGLGYAVQPFHAYSSSLRRTDKILI